MHFKRAYSLLFYSVYCLKIYKAFEVVIPTSAAKKMLKEGRVLLYDR